MTRHALSPTPTTGGQERLGNALALLALVAIGVVWPPLELTDTRRGGVAVRREIVAPRTAVAEERTAAQSRAGALRAAAAPERASRRGGAAGSRSCVPAELGRARPGGPTAAAIGPPRA